jgi:hypothetical protein
MNKKKLSLFIASFLIVAKFYGQQTTTPIHIDFDKTDENDSVFLYVSTDSTAKPGSLMVVVSSSQINLPDTSFYPVIHTNSSIIFLVPKDFRTGTLSVQIYFYPKIFEVHGKVSGRTKKNPVNAILITDNKQFYNKQLKLNEDNEFTMPGLVFEKKASLVFNYAKSSESKIHPDVSISQVPVVSDFKNLIFSKTISFSPVAGNNIDTSKQVPNIVKPVITTPVDKKYKVMGNVTVTTRKKSQAEKFDEEYASEMFRSIGEKIINCLDNDNIISFPDCISYLRTQIPGVTIGIDKFGESYMQWRGHETHAFYIDEMEVDIDQVLSISTAIFSGRRKW